MCRVQLKKDLFDHHLLKKIQEATKKDSKRPIKTGLVAQWLVPEMLGLTIAVHNGRHMFLFILLKIWWP